MATSSDRLQLGISACLLGTPVRFNAGHKQSTLCTEQLSQHFDFVAICPEVAIGLNTPREAIRLVGEPQAPRAVFSRQHNIDVTDTLNAYGQKIAAELTDISGYILMQKSPSCGMERVKVYGNNGYSLPGGGRGIFAAALMRARPELPVEEDGRLHDPVLRENFITRVYVYADWQRMLKAGLSLEALYSFHARYKHQLMATSPQQYQTLGRFLAQSHKQALEPLAANYFSQLMIALKQLANRASHSHVLQHMVGYLKRNLSAQDKQELQNLITQYRQGIVPLVVPLTLITHHFRHHPDAYIAQQSYLQPHPEDLGLRNAI